MQKRFKVIFSPRSQREIDHLEINSALQIAKDIKTYLEISPLPFGKTRIKKIMGFYPLRSGNFRVYYRIISIDVVILAITHKKDSEKVLKKLRQPSAP